MGRLIDADDIEFKKKFCKRFCANLADVTTCKRKENCGIMEWIDNQPTAYDVDKVVEQLKECERYVYDAVSDEDNYVIDTEKAIEIVKGAVKDESHP